MTSKDFFIILRLSPVACGSRPCLYRSAPDGDCDDCAKRSMYANERKRIQANRENSRKSSGPKRARTKLGLFSRAVLLPGESKPELLDLHRRLHVEHQPEGDTQELLVDNVVACAWELQRALAEHIRRSLDDEKNAVDKARRAMDQATQALRLWRARHRDGRRKPVKR